MPCDAESSTASVGEKNAWKFAQPIAIDASSFTILGMQVNPLSLIGYPGGLGFEIAISISSSLKNLKNSTPRFCDSSRSTDSSFCTSA